MGEGGGGGGGGATGSFPEQRLVIIDHFTVVYLATWPLNGSEAGGDLALIKTCLLLSCKCT